LAAAGGGDPGRSNGSHESGFNAADSFKQSWHFPNATPGEVYAGPNASGYEQLIIQL